MADLPQPYATKASGNGPQHGQAPTDAWPKALRVSKSTIRRRSDRAARDPSRSERRYLRCREHHGPIEVFRGVTRTASRSRNPTFATGLKQNFGIAFYPLGENPQVGLHRQHEFRGSFPLSEWRPEGDRTAETIVPELPTGGGHSTRDLAFSPDGTQDVCLGRFCLQRRRSRHSPRRNSTAPTSWNTRRKANSSRSTPRAFAIRSASP